MKRIVTAKKMKKKLYFSIMIFVLTAVMAFSAVGACFFTSPNVVGNASADKSDLSSLKGFDKDKVLSDLKADLIKSINKDLIKNVSDYKLSGRVNAIITFSETSLVDEYNTNYGGKGTLEEFLQSSEAKKYVERVTKRQTRVTDKLVNEGLVSNVKYGYNAILDGVYVSTTYENLEAITKFDGVSRVIVSNTYLPAVATENPVNVYDTGIFNSSDVSYTGKGTIVAILDTGCDYTHTAFNTHQVSEPLYDRSDIDKLLPNTLAYGYDNTLEAREVYYGNITKNKIAWGYDYADKDPDVMPFASDHGTHVAGIIGGKDDVITGVAVDTQLAIMKVFSDYKDGADDGDILAALEDCVKLGVDAINMSLGTSCGFTREVDEDRKNQIYDSIEKAGISLVVAASNDYSSAYGSEFGNTNKTRNPDSATVGAPSTYSAALSVASINGNKDKYMLANGEREVFFLEAFNQSAKEYNFFEMMGITEGNSQTFDYVAIPGYGYSTNYVGADVTGKIALVKRGDISFEEKVQFAYENGAIAVIIYNNVFGDIVMTVGNDVKIPVVSIGKDDGDILASVNKGTEQEGRGTLKFEYSNQAGPFMSDFSSWGPNPDLTLKPEITAHGGNIYSAVPGGGYDKLSGTSMACPNMCGITILIRQYVKENFPELTTCEVRDLVNQLCMSTATIALDKKGNPYSPRKQGAGIADIKKATSTNAYLFVEGKGKTKLELGDDPNRTGVYTMTVSLKNISDKPVSYKIGNLTMTESLSSSDKKYVAEMAYMLSNSAKYSVEGGTLSGSTVTVAAGQTAKVTATITLSPKDKVYINNSFENGMYVEGFLTFDNTDENGVDLNAPFLAFFGDWSDAPIFDEDYYVVETEAHNNAIDDEDKIKADYYATTPLGKYYYDYIIPLGSYVYDMDDGDTPIPATAEHAAISYYKDCISGVYAVFTGLLRGAKEMNIKIVNTATGEVVWEKTEYNAYKAHYSGIQYPYVADIDLDMANTKTGEVFGDNNAHYEVTMSATLDWNGGERNVNDTYKFSFYIDYEAPMIIDSAFRTEYDKTRKENRYYVDLTVYDNHYAMSLRPVVLYSYVDEKGQTKRTFASLSENAIPVYQEKRASQTKVSVEITDYIDVIKQSGLPEGITFYIDDFAMNSNVYYVPFPELQNNNLEFVNQVEGNLVPTLNLKKGQTFDLTTIMRDSRDPNRAIEKDYLKNLTWTSSNPNVVAVSDGKIEAMQENTGIKISVKGETWDRAKELIVNVIGETDDPSSSQNVQIEDIAFTSYKTVYAYNGDIDRSEIGRTDGIGYFDGNYTLNFYPGESVQLNYSVKPWNLSPSRYKLKWSSSNEKVATVDDKGVVKGLSEGRARIFLNIEVDGRDSILQARCTVNIKSEFVIENRELVAYKGLGGVVEIPDDKGILYIGSFAFCHYNLDNEKEVGDKYDLDEKKEPLGNNSVTKVIIPDGVEEIRKFAFYNCEVLQEVVIGKDCKKIFEYAFYKNTKLLNINLDNVKVISDYAFAECSVLNNNDNGGLNFASVNVLGKYSFANCKQLLAANLTDLRRSGEGAFYGCSKLSTVVLGERARLAEQMFANSAVGEITVYSDTIPDGAFYGCTRLSRVTVANDITYLGDEAFRGCTRLYNFAFNGECEYIGSAAFYGCTSLAQFVLPNGTVAFGDNVFGSCSSLKYVTLGAETQISDVGAMIFNGLGGTSIGINAALSNYYKVSSRVLFSKDGTELILALPNNSFSNGTYVVPASVKIIRDGAFSANRNLVTLDARSCSLEKIGDSAFSYCVNLTTVLLGGSNVDIGNLAFCEAVALRTIDLGNVSIIGDFAFYNTNLQTAAFKEGAAIGYKAFSVGRSTVTGMNFSGRLTNVYLGKNNVVSDYAFAESAVITVEMPSDGGVTVGAYAFYNCASLERIDLTKVSQIGEYSFARCVKLSSVDLGNLTEVPEAAFSGASSLKSVTADNLVIVGKDAFSQLEFTNNGFPVIIDGPVITEIDLPSAKEIGDYAFYGCMQLQTANIPLAMEIGEAAFQFCEKLENVTLSENLKIVSDGLFYGCEALDISSFDFKNVEKVGKMSFLAVKLPATLNLPEVTQLGEQAFGEAERKYSQTGSFEYVPSQNPVLVSVNAPKLTTLSDYAFYGNGALKTLNAPNLRYIGYMAFSKTAVSEFEVNDSLEFVSYGAFFEADVLSAFYATVKGEKTYDAALKNVKVHQGVLYLASEKGYVLANYPMAKTASEYTVPEGTVRIEFMAGYGNKALEKVVLPQTMKFVGNMAFYSCDNLKTVEFRSYYAPTLEGTMSGTLDILPDAVDAGNFPKFDELYKYDYYYYMQKQLVKEALENGSSYTPEFGVPYPLYYANFVDFVTTKKASALTYVIPDNCSGYDSALYKAYFNKSEETSGKVTGSFAVAFIEAVGEIKGAVDRFSSDEISNAVSAYNALVRHQDELALVDKAVIDKYNDSLSRYNVDVVKHLINKLTGIDSSNRSRDLISQADAAYKELSESEKAQIDNYAKLQQAKTDFAKAVVDYRIYSATEAINKLEGLDASAESYALLKEAVNAYNALTANEKEQITNYAKLQQAIADYNAKIAAANADSAEANGAFVKVAVTVSGMSFLLAVAMVMIKKLMGGSL